MSKLFQCFISHVTTSETETNLFQPLTLFQNCFSDTEHVGKDSWAAMSFWNNFEIISGKFPRAEINSFSRTSTKTEIILCHMQPRHYRTFTLYLISYSYSVSIKGIIRFGKSTRTLTYSFIHSFYFHQTTWVHRNIKKQHTRTQRQLSWVGFNVPLDTV